MKWLWSVLIISIVGMLATLPAAAQFTQAQITSDIASFLASGQNPPIPAASVRNVLNEINNTAYIATGATAARILPDRFADVINVMDYGALCNSGGDDGPAINSAIAAARTFQAANLARSVAIVFPAGRFCNIKSTLNFTGHHSLVSPTPFGASFGGLFVLGANISCEVSGGPCIDALGALGLTFRDMNIFGNQSLQPTIAFQFGVTISGTTAANNTLSNVKIWGFYSFTAIYNFGSEVFDYDRVAVVNSADAYAVVIDGENHWNITSAFEPETIPQNTPVSMNDSLFRGGSYQTLSTTKGAFWISGAGRMRALGIYSSTLTPCNVNYYIFSANYYGNNENIWDAHFETTAVHDTFCFDGSVASPILKGFRYSTEHASQVSNSTFKIVNGSTITSMEMDDLDYSVVLSPQTQGSPTKVFDAPTAWTVNGKAYVSDLRMWNAPAAFSGHLCYGNANSTTPACTFTTTANTVNAFASPGFSVNGSGIVTASGSTITGSNRLLFDSGSTAFNQGTSVLDMGRKTLSPASVVPTTTMFTSGLGNNSTFIGVSGGFWKVADDPSVTISTKGVLYGLQISMAPQIARNNAPFDDVGAIIISNDSQTNGANGTDAVYVGHNSVFTAGAAEWGSTFTADANAFVAFTARGSYQTGLDFCYGGGCGVNQATFSNAPIRAPQITPASQTTTCSLGSIEWDANFIYACTANNNWRRAALSDFSVLDGGLIAPPIYYAQSTGSCVWDGGTGHDVGPCINTAITNAATNGGTVILPCGTFYFATQIVNQSNGVGIRGCGAGSYDGSKNYTALKWNGANHQSPAILIGYESGTSSLYHADFWGIAIDGNSTADVGLEISQTNNSFINASCIEAQKTGCWISSSTSTSSPSGTQENDIWLWASENSNTNATGVLIDGRSGWGSGTGNVSLNRFHSLEARTNGGDGIVFGYSDTNVVYFARTQHVGSSLGSQFVVANSAYTPPNGVAVAGQAQDLQVQFASAPVSVKGYTTGAVWTANGGNSGTAALNPLTISTNSTTAGGNTVLHFASTTGVGLGETVNCGGTTTGVYPNTFVQNFSSTTVTMLYPAVVNGTISGVASGQSCTFSFGVTSGAVPGTYTITATAGSTYNITAPSGGTSQTGVVVSNGILLGEDIVVPITGTASVNDSFTLVVPTPASQIAVNGVDKANSISDPGFELGALGYYQTVLLAHPVTFTASSSSGNAGGGGIIGAAPLYWGAALGESSLTTNVQSGKNTWIIGGGSQTVSGNYAMVIGGFTHNVSGFAAVALGGETNTLSGAVSVALGGIQGTDRGRLNEQVFSSNKFATQGDAQSTVNLLRGTGSSTGAIRLTADAGAAGSANCINIPNNTGYLITVDVMAFDHTTVTKNETWNLWGGLLTRGANAASTALTMQSTPTPLSNGTVTGSAIAATADTTQGCLNLSFTPPTGNSDTWNVVARVTTIEVQ